MKQQAKKKKKKRDTITLAIAIERIDKMLLLIIDDVRSAIALEATLNTGNEIIHKINSEGQRPYLWYGANCYDVLHNSVGLHLALTLAKLFDEGAKRLPRNRRDVASIPLLVRLLRQTRCQRILAERARSWTPGLGMAAEHEQTVHASVVATIAAHKALYAKQSGRVAVAALRNFRNKKLAHTLMDVSLASIPRYEQLFFLLDSAIEIMQHVRLAVAGQNWEPQEFRDERRQQGRAFWEPAIKAVIEAENGIAN